MGCVRKMEGQKPKYSSFTYYIKHEFQVLLQFARTQESQFLNQCRAEKSINLSFCLFQHHGTPAVIGLSASIMHKETFFFFFLPSQRHCEAYCRPNSKPHLSQVYLLPYLTVRYGKVGRRAPHNSAACQLLTSSCPMPVS